MVADFPRKGRKAQRKPRRTSGQEERFLATEEAIKALGAGIVHQKRRELAKRKKVLARRVPSSAWMDSTWDGGETFPPPYDHSRVHPLTEPPATTMKMCRGCRRETPPQCVGSSGHCDDCRLGAMSAHALSMLPPSPGVIDMGRLKKNARAGRDYHA
jgi:hypothetical protein